MAGYTRQSTIADGNTIDASLFNNEYNQLLAAFSNATGHKHDGTAAEGPVIGLIGDAGLATPLNKISIDTGNDHIKFYIDVASSSVEQLNILDGVIKPATDNDIDLGSSTHEFKDGYFDGTVNLDALVIGTATAITDVDTDLTSVSGSNDTLASAKAIKTYVDAQVTASDLDFSGDTGGSQSIDLDSQSLTLTGGTGIDTTGSAQTMTFAIDSTVATLAGSQILTNKTLTSPTLTSPVLNTAISGTAFLDEDDLASNSATKVASQQSIKSYIDNNVSSVTPSSTTTFTNKTIDANGTGNSITNLEVADLASGVLDTDLTSVSGSDNTLASAKAIKTYVDTNVSSVTPSSTTTFTNKTIDVDATGNSLTNIANANIKASAAIDATKIADGSVTSTEFQYINSLSSNAQTQIDSKAPLASPALTGNPTAPTQAAGNNSTRLATTAYVDNSTAARDQLGEMTDVTLASLADANYFIYDNSASVWKNKAISGAITSDKDGVTTLASAIDATKIADGTVTSTEFQYINSLTSNAQTQLDAKQATIDSSSRLNANLVGDGSVDNTEYGYLNGVTSAIQSQIDSRASAGFAVAMAIAL